VNGSDITAVVKSGEFLDAIRYRVIEGYFVRLACEGTLPMTSTCGFQKREVEALAFPLVKSQRLGCERPVGTAGFLVLTNTGIRSSRSMATSSIHTMGTGRLRPPGTRSLEP
jgi:hypothetical protein